MEVCSTSIPTIPQIFSRKSLFSPKFSFPSLHHETSRRYKVTISKLSSYPSVFTHLSFSKTKKFQISAHFERRPSNRRRNSLRKKIVDDQQVSKSLISFDPDRSFNGNESFSSNLDYDDGIKESDSNYEVGEGIVESSSVEEPESESKILGDSVLKSKLESWVEQYKKDVEFWGNGSGPIFTVFQDSDGNVEKVVVNEDEILGRNGEFEDLPEVNLKISHAKHLAKEMENGNNVIPRNSSVAKFVVSGEQTGFVDVIRGVTLQPGFYSKLSRVGISLLCGFFVLWAVKSLLSVGKGNVELTRLEKEMLRRKIKSRMEKEKLEKGSVEVIQEPFEHSMVLTERPKLDKQALVNTILNAKASTKKLALPDSSRSMTTKSEDIDDKIQEIREMAKKAREIEGKDSSQLDRDEEEEDLALDEELSHAMGVVNAVNQQGGDETNLLSNLSKEDSRQTRGIDGSIESASLDTQKGDDTGFLSKVSSVDNDEMQASSITSTEDLEVRQSKPEGARVDDCTLDLLDEKEVIQNSGSPQQSYLLEKNSSKTKPRVIRSVKEAREYLSRKRDKQEQNQERQVSSVLEGDTFFSPQTDREFSSNITQGLDSVDEMFEPSTVGQRSDTAPIANAFEGDTFFSPQTDREFSSNITQGLDSVDKMFEPSTVGQRSDTAPIANAFEDSTLKRKESVPSKNNDQEDTYDEYHEGKIEKPQNSQDFEGRDSSPVTGSSVGKDNWLEKNFHEFEPVLKKIGVGFRGNYMVAKEKVNQESNISSELKLSGMNEDGSELEWMKDDHLSEIVFQVRENELAGRDPFYMMDAQDKVAFFEGLERKVEKENEKLLKLHEYVHSNIENLDYGADGISIHDPPEKFIPRWKGPPPLEKNPEFLNNFLEQRDAIFSEITKITHPVRKDEVDSLQKSKEPTPHGTSSLAYDPKNKLTGGASKNAKTVIESSDGSVKTGKKTGKEYWQHTKKWSRGFLESYNAETDPEVKSIMKDMGKDLDRWITEKEIQESADLMDKLPERNKKFIEKKLEKLKREMELFGPQAVVSKYSEYGEEKVEDYLWWLDLPFVLCIELYTNDNGEQRIGFYSLEMAADLELEPKPYHVIAFEDSDDCKNLCYIIQAHMEMLGNGHAFVVARPPKDAFREAKANGFSVTVIRKGELPLNVDQTLEEVEEQINEIGSKIYHDKITQERSVDMSSLMKGVFGASKPTKRRRSKKRRLKKPRKQ